MLVQGLKPIIGTPTWSSWSQTESAQLGRVAPQLVTDIGLHCWEAWGSLEALVKFVISLIVFVILVKLLKIHNNVCNLMRKRGRE